MTGRVRPPAAAGTFYPDDPNTLAREVDHWLLASPTGATPKALIAPHAGYQYSGVVAGSAYATITAGVRDIERVIVIGPAHFVPLRGVAVSGADGFATPLGVVNIDEESRSDVLSLPFLREADKPHAPEHSVEVQLPFLQRLLGRFLLVPLVVGDVSKTEVADVLDRVWGGDETLIVVSSDLSHYLDPESARTLDGRTAEAIRALDADAIGPNQACGYAAIRGALELARRRGMTVELLDLRNSGDTAGTLDRVVGYGAFAVRSG